jgi:glycine/D-amino acid oxidase-like deaminating enzyme
MIQRGHGPRVAVVGGGVLGVSTAAQLTKRGARVTLLTEAGLASGASGRSLSWLNSFGRRSSEYHRLRLLGLDRYRTFSSRIDSAAYLRFDGGLTWAAREVKGHRSAFEHMRQVDYPAEWLAARRCRPGRLVWTLLRSPTRAPSSPPVTAGSTCRR